MHSGDLFLEAAARAAYALGDHLHPWADASEDLRDDYRAVMASMFAGHDAITRSQQREVTTP